MRSVVQRVTSARVTVGGEVVGEIGPGLLALVGVTGDDDGAAATKLAEKIWHLEPRTQRKPRSLEAIKKVDNDPILFVAVARIFWGERRLEKAASWFEKAILLDSDLGDTWAWYYKFVCQHGTDEKREEVISKCVLSEPKHGEVWQAVAKDPKNWGKGIEEILKLVAAKLE